MAPSPAHSFSGVTRLTAFFRRELRYRVLLHSALFPETPYRHTSHNAAGAGKQQNRRVPHPINSPDNAKSWEPTCEKSNVQEGHTIPHAAAPRRVPEATESVAEKRPGLRSHVSTPTLQDFIPAEDNPLAAFPTETLPHETDGNAEKKLKDRAKKIPLKRSEAKQTDRPSAEHTDRLAVKQTSNPIEKIRASVSTTTPKAPISRTWAGIEPSVSVRIKPSSPPAGEIRESQGTENIRRKARFSAPRLDVRYIAKTETGHLSMFQEESPSGTFPTPGLHNRHTGEEQHPPINPAAPVTTDGRQSRVPNMGNTSSGRNSTEKNVTFQSSEAAPKGGPVRLAPQLGAYAFLLQDRQLQERYRRTKSKAFHGQRILKSDSESPYPQGGGPLQFRGNVPAKAERPAIESPPGDATLPCRTGERNAFPGSTWKKPGLEDETSGDRLKEELVRILSDEARRMGIDLEN